MNAELRFLLNARSGEDAILAAARASGLSTLRDESIKLVREGTTTIEEIACLPRHRGSRQRIVVQFLSCCHRQYGFP